jgi:DNA polymerase III epsilon subunit-like protein
MSLPKEDKNTSSNIVLVFDTETTGLVNSRIIQLSFILYDIEKSEIIFFSEKNKDYILLPAFYDRENINEKWLANRMNIEDELNILISELEKQKKYISKDEYNKQRQCLHEKGSKWKNIIPLDSTISHNIFDSTLYKYGRDLNLAINEFIEYFYMADVVVGHNISFDIKMICVELIHLLDEKYIKLTCQERKAYIQLFHDLIDDVNDRENVKNPNFHKEKTKLIELFKISTRNDDLASFEKNKNKKKQKNIECTMKMSTISCRLRQAFEYKKIYSAGEISRLECSPCHIWKLYKSPQLAEAHKILFSQNVRGELHDSRVDVCVTLRVFVKLYKNNDICNYASTLKNHNNIICDIIKPEDITDARDFPIQLYFKKLDKNDTEFSIDPRPCFKQTKEMIFKTIENRLRELKQELKTLLPIKILEIEQRQHSSSKSYNSLTEENEESIGANNSLNKEYSKSKYSKSNPRRNPRRSTRNSI